MTILFSRYKRVLAQARHLRQRIDRLYKNGVTQSEIARCVGVSRQRINQIVNARAHRSRKLVKKRVKSGKLTHPSKLKCVDCGKSASQYDHRDYAKPFEIVPVCDICNRKRGHGKNGKFRGDRALARRKMIQQWIKLGRSYQSIARQLGISRQRVHQLTKHKERK